MIVLITGCRSGFGLLTAVDAARRGHTVYAGLRDLGTAGELQAAAGGLPVHPVQLDVTDPAQREAVLTRILEEHGRLDVLVNNAGIGMGGFVETFREDEIRKVFDVNLFGAWGMIKASLPALRRAESGLIVNVSSMSGVVGLPGLGVYASSKFALEGMSEALRNELKLFGIRVVSIQPGPYKTPIWGRNRLTCEAAGHPDSPYREAIDVIMRVYDHVGTRQAEDPREVSARIVSLFDDPDPSFRHPMGKGAYGRAMAKKLLPWRLMERSVFSGLKLHTVLKGRRRLQD